ncbi:MAG TPA: cyclic nucleotide-binding domain-containing protein [Acidimicrobiales bacterium]|nr:cyclic nucleotide-binding domain-containing protein [Acidimicrobiales bacterium]
MTRYESSVTALSWIPSEAVEGMTKLPFELGVAHYDAPPPDVLEDLEALRLDDRFRFANELRAWVEVRDGHIVGYGQTGQGHIGSTTVRLGKRAMVFQAVSFPDLRSEQEIDGHTAVRFVQTAGGRTGAPAPRRVRRPPFVQMAAPTAWSTLELVIRADGTSEFTLTGASPFPRHWVYDDSGKLAAKTGMIDFDEWYRTAFGGHTPWGDEDSPAFVTVAETAIERELSRTIMGGDKKPKVKTVDEGDELVRQGEEGHELFVLLDGVLAVEVDGEAVAEVGPGAILGERAVLEGGRRTSTLRAVTRAKVAVAGADDVDRAALEEVAGGHRREDER